MNALQKKLIQAQLELSNKEFEKSKVENDETKKILAAKQALIESKIFRPLPFKYSILNESNIQNAKVYIDTLIENDEEQKIQGLCDFKRAFRQSDLLYGKDDTGYFAVCVDQEDFNKLTNTLEETGYMKEEIFAHILPQIFDRRDII